MLLAAMKTTNTAEDYSPSGALFLLEKSIRIQEERGTGHWGASSNYVPAQARSSAPTLPDPERASPFQGALEGSAGPGEALGEAPGRPRPGTGDEAAPFPASR